MKLDDIKQIMDWLRNPCKAIENEILRLFRSPPIKEMMAANYGRALPGESILEELLLEDPGYLIIPESGDKKLLLTVTKGLTEKFGFSRHFLWHYFTSAKTLKHDRKLHDTTDDFESVVIINLNKIADSVLKKME